MSLYAVEIDLDRRNTSHTQVVELVGRDKRVLDVGCWTGELGTVLQTRGCQVTGYELNEEAAAIASTVLANVVTGNLDRERLTDRFEPGTFDAIVFADVLEHLYDPSRALRDAVTLLAPGGRIITSIPNVTHGALRLALLQGRWETTDTGLLDHTHIRFYSRASLLRLFNDAGLVVEELRGTLADPLRTEVVIDDGALPAHLVEWVRNQPDALVYQFQLSARAAEPGEPASSEPELIEAVESSQVRLRDGHYAALIESEKEAFEAKEDVVQAARDVLLMKDHVIGLQAQATSATTHAARLQRQIKRVRARTQAKEQANARLRARIAELEKSVATLRGRGLRGVARRLLR